MDTIKIIQIFNKVITSKELDRKIIYKFLNHILSKHNIILVEGDIYIKEIRSHIVDNTINNNYLIRVNKNQFFSLGINENFDKIDYVLRTYYDLFEEVTKLKLENEELFSSTHAIINLDIFNTKEVAKLILKNKEGIVLKSPLNIININVLDNYDKMLELLTPEERKNLINLINKQI